MGNGYTSNAKSGHDSIPYAVAQDIIREAKGLLDMASKGLPPGDEKTKLTKVRNELWGIMRKLKAKGKVKK